MKRIKLQYLIIRTLFQKYGVPRSLHQLRDFAERFNYNLEIGLKQSKFLPLETFKQNII
jgi:hypothetical protein